MRRLLHTVKWNMQLPDWYTELAGLGFNNNCYFTITDFKLTWDDSIKVVFTPTIACNLLWSYTNTSSQKNYSIYLSTSSWAKYLRYNWWTYKSYITINTKYELEVTSTWSYWNDSSLNDTWTAKTFTADTDMYIWTTSTWATSAKFSWTIWGDIEVAGRLRLRPCKRNSDNVLWYYDLYGSTFYIPTVWTPTAVTS